MQLTKGDEVLITGSNGFIGSALTKQLIKKGEYNIKTFDLNNGNVEDYDFSGFDVKHICHLAARTFIPQSWNEPYDYYKVNFMGTLNILEYCRKHGAGMTFLSTYMYGTPRYLPVDEKHPKEAHSVYNHTKLLAEEACEFYSLHFGVSVTILRLFNVYGAGQQKDFLIPSIIQQALKGDYIEVMDTRPKRDFVYIDDVINAICLCLGKEGFNVYNVGSGCSFSVLEIIKIICDVLGEEKKIIDKNQPRVNEIMDIIADTKKIRTELAWQPKISFEEGIRKTLKI